MSFRAMQIINRLTQVVTMITFFVGYLWLLNLAGSLAVGAGILGLLVACGVLSFALSIRRGRPSKSTIGFGAILRTHHNTDHISVEEIDLVLGRLIDDPRLLGRVVEGSRCLDCGHEEILLQSGNGELFGIVRGLPFTHTRVWFFGLFGMWIHQTPVVRLTGETATPVE